VTAEARAALRRYVAQPSTRSCLHAYVRRRGFCEDADDLVQTVLCDALAVQAVPVEASDLPRWITGIASKKVADERRRRARWKQADLPERGINMHPEVADLLRRIDADLILPEQRRSLGWLLQEHAGDSLFEIAREHAIRPETLRQRICRLRRHLRAHHVGPLLLALGIGVAAASFDGATTVSSPSADTTERFTAYEGSWRVVDVAPSKYLALRLRVNVRGGTARVEGPTGILERELAIDASGDRVTLRAGDAMWEAQLIPLDGDHVRLKTARGFAVLERIR
jgi:DNA-directed RNA polymerase specialized sigma24 family protein